MSEPIFLYVFCYLIILYLFLSLKSRFACKVNLVKQVSSFFKVLEAKMFMVDPQQ